MTMNLSDDDIAKCEACGCIMDVSMVQPFTNVECPECATHNRVKVDVGSYILKKRQGVGGMSLVFGAVDKTLGREVAIKILNESYSMDEKRIEQFEQEAKITAAISHPHVVKVYTVGQAFQRFFIAMELVPGGSLEKKMRDKGKLSESDVLKWGRQVCEGLNAANEAGLIHRDIKPGNILFDAEGNVKIVDFGLALVTQGGKAKADEIWATPYYVPPETLDVLEEDFRSDIYALGASLFHALSGKPPFDKESRSTSELKQIKINIQSLKKCAPWLSDETCAVVDKAMEFDIEDRYGSYKEMIDALSHAEIVLKNEGMQPAMNSSERYSRREGDKGARSLGIIVVGLLMLVGVIIALTQGDGSSAQNDRKKIDNKPLGIEGSDDGGAAGRRLATAIGDGREALQTQDYDRAANHYAKIARDNRYEMKSTMWAGLQAGIVNWLNGKPAEAKSGLRLVKKHYDELMREGQPVDASELTLNLVNAIPLFIKMERIEPGFFGNVDTEVDAMIILAAALKNWEEGYISDAVKLFESVRGFALSKGTDLSEEFKVYVTILDDYLYDAVVMEPFMKAFIPVDEVAISERKQKLERMRPLLKTNGRAVENVEEWLIQLGIHTNRIAYERRLAAEKLALNKADSVRNEPAKNEWANFMKSLEKEIQTNNFKLMNEKLEAKNFLKEESNEKKEQMIYLSKLAAGYIGTLSETLDRGIVKAEIVLKDGEIYDSFSEVDEKGISVKGAETARRVRWGDITTGSVLDLLRISISNADLSQFEKNLRLEQAIAFAWLGDEKEKAYTAAASLQESNPLFKDRWETCMKVLVE